MKNLFSFFLLLVSLLVICLTHKSKLMLLNNHFIAICLYTGNYIISYWVQIAISPFDAQLAESFLSFKSRHLYSVLSISWKRVFCFTLLHHRYITSCIFFACKPFTKMRLVLNTSPNQKHSHKKKKNSTLNFFLIIIIFKQHTLDHVSFFEVKLAWKYTDRKVELKGHWQQKLWKEARS